MSTFQGRLILQKTVYLLQAFGISLGYRYSWYLFGPYSAELARDGFELAAGVPVPAVPFEGKGREALARFMDFIGPYRHDAHMLELLASFHMLMRLANGDLGKVTQFLQGKKTKFTAAEISNAQHLLNGVGLV